MVTVLEKSDKKLTVKFVSPFLSKDGIYINNCGDFKLLSEDDILKAFSDLKSLKKTGVFIYEFTPSSKSDLNNQIKKDNVWLNSKNSRIENGGIFTMLSNKGWL